MSNLPEGVTDGDPHIAGVTEDEFFDERTCNNCGATHEVPILRWLAGRTVTETWTCPNPECDAPDHQDDFGLDEYTDDPDRGRD